MQVVIDISEEIYQEAIKSGYSHLYDEEVANAVADGTSLPKGHGRIGDLDALEQEMLNGIKAGNYEDGYDDYPHINNVDDCVDCVRYADAIIGADRAESEEEG